jgi:hypothetical protein
MAFGFKKPGEPVSVNLINKGPICCYGLCRIGMDRSTVIGNLEKLDSVKSLTEGRGQKAG